MVGDGPEGKLSLFADVEVTAVGAAETPYRLDIKDSPACGRVCRQNTLEILRPAEGGGAGDLVYILDCHRHVKVAVVPPVVGPDGDLVHVVPVEVGRALMVRRVPEGKDPALPVNGEVAAIPSRCAPADGGGNPAGGLRVDGGVASAGQVLIFIDGERVAARYHWSLV